VSEIRIESTGFYERGADKIEVPIGDVLEASGHIWLNAFLCVRPSDEFLRDIGRAVLDKVNESPYGAWPGVGRQVLITVVSS
jgi:hypothetical protein